MRTICLLPLGFLMTSLLAACGEPPPVVDTPIPLDDSEASPARERLHLDYAWGTATVSGVQQMAVAEGPGDVILQVETAGRPIDDQRSGLAPRVHRDLVFHRVDGLRGNGVSFQIRDENSRTRYELGVLALDEGSVLYEQSDEERLEIRRSPRSDGRMEHLYRFEDRTGNHTAVWAQGEAPGEELLALQAASSVLASSPNARLISSLLSDPRFVRWFREQSDTGLEVVDVQMIPEEVERICDAIDNCRDIICENNPQHPICLACTAGSLICELIRILF